MIESDNKGLVALTEASAKEYLTRGGWTKGEAILILNGLDPVANRYLLHDDTPPADSMLATYWHATLRFAPDERVIPVEVWLDWAVSGTKKEPRHQPLTFSRELQEGYRTKDFKLLARRLKYATVSHTSPEPWWAAHPDDPEPKAQWWIPARYFARLFIKDDPALLKRLSVLAEKVRQALADHHIYKRGEKEPPMASTIKNTFSNVNLRA